MTLGCSEWFRGVQRGLLFIFYSNQDFLKKWLKHVSRRLRDSNSVVYITLDIICLLILTFSSIHMGPWGPSGGSWGASGAPGETMGTHLGPSGAPWVPWGLVYLGKVKLG